MWMVHACMYVHVYYIHACSLVPTLLHQKTGREPGYEATCMLTGHNITPGYIAQPWWIGFRRLVDNIYTLSDLHGYQPLYQEENLQRESAFRYLQLKSIVNVALA